LPGSNVERTLNLYQCFRGSRKEGRCYRSFSIFPRLESEPKNSHSFSPFTVPAQETRHPHLFSMFHKLEKGPQNSHPFSLFTGSPKKADSFRFFSMFPRLESEPKRFSLFLTVLAPRKGTRQAILTFSHCFKGRPGTGRPGNARILRALAV
jgi:hypothetical protein